MDKITIEFTFSRDGEIETAWEDFDVEGDLLDAINDYAEEWIAGADATLGAEMGSWALDEFTVSDYDTDYADPDSFKDLNEYAAYAEMVEKYGEVYHLRYEDVGESNFDNQYVGCYDNEEDFAYQHGEESGDVPARLSFYIDYEKYARDLMMDHSSYDCDGGCHIFRD